MTETYKQFRRRELAINTADKIMKHPAYPFELDFPRAMITIIELALKEWEVKNSEFVATKVD